MKENRPHLKFLKNQLESYKNHNNSTNSSYIPSRNIYLVKMLNSLPLSLDVSILDVGIGPGLVAGSIIDLGYSNYEGIDIVDQRDPSLNLKGVKLHTLDLIDITREDLKKKIGKKYDVIILGDVLEHFTHPYEVLYKLEPLTSDNTMLIISVPNAAFFLNFVLLSLFPSKMFFSTAFGPWGHYSYFTFYSLDRICRESGHEKIKLLGGPIDDHVYKGVGIGGAMLKVFRFAFLIPSLLFPSLFSDHIYAIYQKKQKSESLDELHKIFSS